MSLSLHTNSRGLVFTEKRGMFHFLKHSDAKDAAGRGRAEPCLCSRSGRAPAGAWLTAGRPDGTASVRASLATPVARNGQRVAPGCTFRTAVVRRFCWTGF